jgi:hypothetical protein
LTLRAVVLALTLMVIVTVAPFLTLTCGKVVHLLIRKAYVLLEEKVDVGAVRVLVRGVWIDKVCTQSYDGLDFFFFSVKERKVI